MEPNGSLYHFLASFAIVLASGPALFLALRRTPPLLLTLASGLAALAVGLAKEFYDLAENPWALSAAQLRADSAGDMGWNLAGAAAGAALLLATFRAVRLGARLIRRSLRQEPAKECTYEIAAPGGRRHEL